ncbi:glycoside hydrolase family 16 protein [Laccaria bicolor S238N-H82]|uniref:Glycoside hydrolase family 16 protein n=1 Tax=Laccaria bicolor (strain S238N-H82 / ATCC MYA-4686) TaxID=486041 RepID=B0DSY1_LACBS|nr:glycoside hydrolase family 16 protein [Laccaria bicolor S238N-H82]EDR02394.1 glycoside hydrolase family 16 protein [Laccaria bicolor S238N-H82]|eukprot:XP_001887071.1 glycoside hydrolase family 16 protein [Laccaria bicolor S238N-H82]
MRLFASTALFALSPLPLVLGATYLLTDNIVGKTFYSNFDWEAIPDPTHGRVNYVNSATSSSQNLTFATSDTFILRTDFKTVLDPNGPGRNSVRIRSKKTYTTHVAVFNMRHMPQGCGTWPAVWETDGANWPNGGEIDILEGVNDQAPDLVSVHTSPGCTMPSSRTMTGTPTYLDCQTGANSNAGCGVKLSTTLSYGPAFNKVGGGWYVIERSPTYMKVWFWSRRDTSVPAEVANGGQYVNPDTWGTPAAYFPNTSCDFPSHFDAHSIIINLTLCGDWAGATYGQTSCPSTCVGYVNNNPSAFTDAYFDFASLRVYGATVPLTKRGVDVHGRAHRREF